MVENNWKWSDKKGLKQYSIVLKALQMSLNIQCDIVCQWDRVQSTKISCDMLSKADSARAEAPSQLEKVHSENLNILVVFEMQQSLDDRVYHKNRFAYTFDGLELITH